MASEFPNVTYPRVEAWLKKEELNYQVDDDGELVVPWDNVLIFIRVTEQVVHIRGQWRGEAEEADREALRKLVTDCNNDRIGPKAVLAIDDEEKIRVSTERNIAQIEGLSEEQLELNLRHALGMTFNFLGEVEETLPHLITWETEED